MSRSEKPYEFRCPVHGFIMLSAWEREVVAQPAFQRLRRIKQLAWTDQVYPGATHTRFEHSLGVLHTTTLLFGAVVNNSRRVLEEVYGYDDQGLARDLQLVRFAALLHDVGHAPFSHGAEDLFPVDDEGERFEHEDYSAAIVRTQFRDVIENHKGNINVGLRADDVAALIEKKSIAGKAVFWRELISGQMDADRMDYLLRDSLHSGVQYGRFDLQRLLTTVVAAIQRGPDGDPNGTRLGVSEGGWHSAEALVLARYFMFTQVYFHKTRVAYDIHLKGALQEMLPGGMFPKPLNGDLKDYLAWDDWRVLGAIAAGGGGDHGRRLATRDHYKEVFHTLEAPSLAELEDLQQLKTKLGDLVIAEAHAEKSWYKTGDTDIPVVSEAREDTVEPLSKHSPVVRSLPSSNKVALYTKAEHAPRARDIRDQFFKSRG